VPRRREREDEVGDAKVMSCREEEAMAEIAGAAKREVEPLLNVSG
jgi:hypothetical protein